MAGVGHARVLPCASTLRTTPLKAVRLRAWSPGRVEKGRLILDEPATLWALWSTSFSTTKATTRPMWSGATPTCAQARTHPAPSRCDDIDERFYKARDAFSAARFKALYRVWKQNGDVTHTEVGSRAIHDAVTAGTVKSKRSSSVTGTVISHPGQHCLRPSVQHWRTMRTRRWSGESR